MAIGRPASRLGAASIGTATALGLLTVAPLAVEPAAPAAAAVTSTAIHYRAAARPADGPLVAWGSDRTGQLGDGHTMDQNAPDPVNLPAGLRATSARAGSPFSVAVGLAGQVWAWGQGTEGELGNGKLVNRLRPVPVQLPKGVKVKAVRAGFHFTVALTTDGRVLTWGDGKDGELGNGHRKSSDVPVFAALPRGVRITAISAGAQSGFALTSAGRVLAWGNGLAGELGIGGQTDRSKPVFVRIPEATKITAVGAGVDDVFAVTSAGALLAWGSNSSFDLGTGKASMALVPAPVILPKHVRVVAAFAGLLHSLALTAGGRVLAWGNNQEGELGDGTFKSRKLPVFAKIPRTTRIVSLAAGRSHSLALTSTGKVLAWGDNSDGELGDGGSKNRKVPFEISVPGQVLSIGAGCEAFTSFAVVKELVA